MSAELKEQAGLQPDLKQEVPQDEGQSADLNVFPKPTAIQVEDVLEDILEERVVSDRRSGNTKNDNVIERRTQQRRSPS